MSLTEKEYNELYKYSLNIANKYVSYKDIAYDIAQNAILSFISSKTQIQSPFMWLRTTVRREAQKYLNGEKKEAAIVVKKTTEPSDVSLSFDDESDDLFKLSIQKIRQILSKEDFEIFKKLKANDFSSKKCADKENIPHETIRTYKKKIRRNILAYHLYEEGWRRDTKILDYNKYLRISRFISKTIESVKKHKLADLRNYMQKIENSFIQELFKDVDTCVEWNVAYLDDAYKVILVCAPFNPMPKVIEFTIKLNKNNFVNVLDVVEKKPMVVLKSSAEEVRKYKDKGKISLTTEQVVSILTNKQTEV